MKKNMLFIFLMPLICANSFILANEPLRMIYNNRDHFINIFNHLSDGTKLDTSTHQYTFLSQKDLFCFRDSSFAYWKLNEASFIESFLKSDDQIKHYKKYRYYIDDSITVSILASLLDYPDSRAKAPGPFDIDPYTKLPDDVIPSRKPIPNWSRDALHALTYNVFFSTLLSQSKEINAHLIRCKEPELAKLKLLVLLKQPDSLLNKIRDSLYYKKRHFDSLLNIMRTDTNIAKKQDSVKLVVTELKIIEAIPLWVKARLGDTIAEKEIVNGIIRNDNEYSVLFYATDASFVWSDSSKIAFIRLFGRDIPRCPPDDKYKLCRSMQDTLLVLLARHYPDETIFSNRLSYNRIEADFCKPATQVAYFNDFAVWIKKQFDIDISYKGFTPYFRTDRSKNKSAIRDLCK